MMAEAEAVLSSSSMEFPIAVVVLITNVVILIGLFVRQGRQAHQVELINKAVNHQSLDDEGKDKPTLIQRMVSVERRTEEIAEETKLHRAWEYRVFTLMAAHVGFTIPHRYDHDEYDSSV